MELQPEKDSRLYVSWVSFLKHMTLPTFWNLKAVAWSANITNITNTTNVTVRSTWLVSGFSQKNKHPTVAILTERI